MKFPYSPWLWRCCWTVGSGRSWPTTRTPRSPTWPPRPAWPSVRSPASPPIRSAPCSRPACCAASSSTPRPWRKRPTRSPSPLSVVSTPGRARRWLREPSSSAVTRGPTSWSAIPASRAGTPSCASAPTAPRRSATSPRTTGRGSGATARPRPRSAPGRRRRSPRAPRRDSAPPTSRWRRPSTIVPWPARRAGRPSPGRCRTTARPDRRCRRPRRRSRCRSLRRRPGPGYRSGWSPCSLRCSWPA